jgi:3-oxoacyl-[acyl-carrier protein] reductase
MDTGLGGKVAMVSGASKGIGRAIAEKLAVEGVRLSLCARGADQLRAVARDLEDKHGTACLAYPADLSHAEDIQGWVRATVEQLGGIDILINNAGVGWFGNVESMEHDDWRRVIDTNITGLFNCCKAAIPHLRRRGGGWIINMSSLAGTNPFAGAAGYCASKAAMDAFSEALMQEVRHDGIRVSYVKPGSVNTDFTGHADPANEWKLRPEDVAQVVMDLVGHDERSLPSRVEIRPSKPPRK